MSLALRKSIVICVIMINLFELISLTFINLHLSAFLKLRFCGCFLLIFLGLPLSLSKIRVPRTPLHKTCTDTVHQIGSKV